MEFHLFVITKKKEKYRLWVQGLKSLIGLGTIVVLAFHL